MSRTTLPINRPALNQLMGFGDRFERQPPGDGVNQPAAFEQVGQLGKSRCAIRLQTARRPDSNPFRSAHRRPARLSAH
jgi:hypothetical protein